MPPLNEEEGDRLVATSYVQRIATAYGLAPPAADCTAATAGTVAEVPTPPTTTSGNTPAADPTPVPAPADRGKPQPGGPISVLLCMRRVRQEVMSRSWFRGRSGRIGRGGPRCELPMLSDRVRGKGRLGR